MKGGKSFFLAPNLNPGKEKHLVAMEISKGQTNAYASVALDDQGEIERYIRGALQLKDKSALGRVRYSADFLHSRDAEVAGSAAQEIERASAVDLRKIAAQIQPEPLQKAIRNGDTPAHHVGAFARLLGYCGKKEDAVLLRKLLDDPVRSKTSRTRLLVAYTMLEPDVGWNYAVELAMPKKNAFRVRFDALQAIREIGADHKDLVDTKKIVADMLQLIEHPDLADFPIEVIRERKLWQHCDAILDLHGKKGYDDAILRRAILRFALQCPTPRARLYIVEQKLLDVQWVEDTEENLKLELDTKSPLKK